MDKNRAKEIIRENKCGIDDGYYNYGLIVTVVDGKVYGEINPIDLSIYKYNVYEDGFEPLGDKDKVNFIVKKRYCFLD